MFHLKHSREPVYVSPWCHLDFCTNCTKTLCRFITGNNSSLPCYRPPPNTWSVHYLTLTAPTPSNGSLICVLSLRCKYTEDEVPYEVRGRGASVGTHPEKQLLKFLVEEGAVQSMSKFDNVNYAPIHQTLDSRVR